MINEGLAGAAMVASDGELLARYGVATEGRLLAFLVNKQWLDEIKTKRLVLVQFSDESYVAISTRIKSESDDYWLINFCDVHRENVLRFFLSVDFAFDIIEHILSDPFDAMVVADRKGKLVFLPPVHERFFGLKNKEWMNQRVTDVIENTRLHHVIKTNVAEVGQLQKMNSQERIVSRHPVRNSKGEVVGAIGRVMFKGPEQVEALAARVSALEAEIKTYRSVAKEIQEAETALEDIIGESEAILHLKEQIKKIAPLDISVLIQGDSGTGKELVAEALHRLSDRRDNRLVSVNAAALPAQLVESELFGYEPGAFTGADKEGRQGKFEQAENGTIFLDEIGDMPLEVQVKLLRILQDQKVERIGGEKPRKIDFRLCSATNRPLEALVEQGKFRLDLFYRISPVIIRVPSLSERLSDIPLLARAFLKEFSDKYNLTATDITPEGIEYLQSRAWPGNIRELRHLIKKASVFCESSVLTVKDFEMEMDK